VTAPVTPWWDAMRLRSEITAGSGVIDDVQMSLFNAVYGTGGKFPPYASAKYYGEITHPSPNLVEFVARVAVRLGGAASYTAAPALWRLDQAMGGGKSHAIIGLWHLAAHPREFRDTEIGNLAWESAAKIIGRALPADLESPQVVVLSCDNMTAGRGDITIDGPATSLYERFLWRLFGGDHSLFKRYQPHFADKAKIAEAIGAVGRPVLILVDEILDYVRQLSLEGHADLANQDLGFLRALTDTVNDVPHVAMVVVMIRSEDDSIVLDAGGAARRQEIEDLLVRNGKKATVTSNTDFAEIIRRRLFEAPAPAEVVRATSGLFERTAKGQWAEKVFAHLPRLTGGDFEAEVERCYPFHPSLIHLAEQEWAPVAGFQKVRSTILIFAATAYSQSERGRAGDWAPMLIGPGDLPLSAAQVREAVIGSGLIADDRTAANYRGVAAADIVSDDGDHGSARVLDLRRSKAPFAGSNPRVAERMATALFLYSIVGSRAQGRQGATEIEVKAAGFAPDVAFTVSDADSVLGDLQDPDIGLASLERLEGRGGQPPRLFLSTRQTLNMLFRAARAGVSEVDRDEELIRVVDRIASTGPFKTKLVIEARAEELDPRPLRAILEAAGIDDARNTRLVVLDPRRFSFLNGIDRETRGAIRAAMGIGDEKLPVQWASSAIFVVMNTQRRKNARAAVLDYVAWARVTEHAAVKADDELKAEAAEKRSGARKDMELAIKRAFQHGVYLGRGEGGEGRADKEFRFEQDNQSSLDGSVVWAKLRELGKTVGVGEFNAKALLHNLQEGDYARPLDEIRDLFWNAPRMPLLPGGDSDLQVAIFEAIQANLLRLVGEDGTERVVNKPSEIGVGSASLRLAPPLPVVIDEVVEPPTDDDDETPKPPTEPDAYPTTPDIELRVSVNTNLDESARRHSVFMLLNDLANVVGDGDASHVQLSASVVVPKKKADTIGGRAQAAGGASSSTPLD
jgi:hypothetical protein